MSNIPQSQGSQLGPHNIEAEEAVLGSIIIAPDSISEVPFLKPTDFFELKNQWIFEAILNILQRKEALDNIILTDEMQARGQLVDIGGPAYITELINACGTWIYIRTYAAVVFACSRRRQAIALAGGIAQAAMEESRENALALADRIKSLLSENLEADNELRPYLVHVSELKNLPPITWLVQGEIPERGLILVYGPSGVGKSFFVLDYALTLAQDIPIVYIATEGENGFHQRVAAWQTHYHRDVDKSNLYFFMNVISLLDEKEKVAFLNLIKPLNPKLIIVDTLAHSMLPGNENDTRDMGLFLKASKLLQKTLDCAVLMVHHTNKGAESERGSSALRGACDTMIKLTEEDEIITVECAKSKDAKPFATRYVRLLPVDLPDGQSSPVIMAAEKVIQTKDDPLTVMQKKVLLAYALDCFHDGASLADIADSTKIARGTVQRISSRLATLGYLVRTAPGGTYILSDTGKRISLTDSSTNSTDSSKKPVGIGLTPVTPKNDDPPPFQNPLLDGVSGVSGVSEAESLDGSSLTPDFEINPRDGVRSEHRTPQEQSIASRHPASIFGPKKGNGNGDYYKKGL
jgi:archaellum biogenesis ATPase FlaH